MNLFGNMSTNHRSWPILLVIYNLPPRLCMKRKYMMLSMMISSANQSGNDINVYLSPLIEDLKLMWDQSVEVFDGFANETFNMHAMLIYIKRNDDLERETHVVPTQGLPMFTNESWKLEDSNEIAAFVNQSVWFTNAALLQASVVFIPPSVEQDVLMPPNLYGKLEDPAAMCVFFV